MGTRFYCVVLLCLLLILHISPTLAQEDVSCAPIVLQALETVDTTCEKTARNQACYGNSLIDVELYPAAEALFEAVGDIAPVAEISRLHTTPLDLLNGHWGIALLKIQANLPDTLPGQNVTFLLTGDVTLTDASAESDTGPMQAFYFTAGIGEAACQNAPNDLVIQSPLGTQVALTVNGVDISLGSTAVLEITSEGAMDVLLVGGAGEISALDTQESVPAGQMTTVELDENGMAVTSPTTARAFDPARVQYIPFELLPETVEVPATAGWVDTGVTLQAGQSFVIGASGLTTTCTGNCPGSGWDIWVPPVGMPLGEACPAKVEGEDIPPEIELCSCLAVRGTCVLQDAPLMLLMGRIGEGSPFIVGAGGNFTAPTAGVLQLSVNDDDFSDNGGAFTAIITVPSENKGVVPTGGCIVMTDKAVNLRGGPGTNYAVAGQLTGSAQVIGQATGADGFVWWQTDAAAWVRSDVVSESGNCASVPVVVGAH